MNTVAQAQTIMRVRGAITGFDGHVLAVKTREGTDLKVNISGDISVNSLAALKASDVNQGSFAGVTAVKKDSGGKLYAREVHVFPGAPRWLRSFRVTSRC